MSSKLKLYVWKDIATVDYGGAILYAIAETEEQARKMAVGAPVAEYGDPWEGKTLDPSDVPDRAPDRVHELPYAEVYQWSE